MPMPAREPRVGRLLTAVVLVFPLAGCAHFLKDSDLDEEVASRRAYRDCLARANQDASRCQDQKNRMLQQQEWEIMDEED